MSDDLPNPWEPRVDPTPADIAMASEIERSIYAGTREEWPARSQWSGHRLTIEAMARALACQRERLRLRVAAMLQKVEYVCDPDGLYPFCPSCHAIEERRKGHAPDCELAALLKECCG